ncbi:hypothetical protein [Herbaspirillum rhizosphaerae]|uniref:hypothetical protein n=1 Tax=Herbaspirillum rhizosphaerae TaxID=346179 RepID=UPI00067DE034|nr:hypothetical protein [Herbaspirillum rhizosphaerae]
MKTPEHIEKIVPDRDGLDFDALRKAGIAMLQELSGEKWTDYNLHDPGVTILEQLCYGITDLAYRSEFAPEDYLAGPFGKIDFTRHALHLADDILPSQVLTASDYRKIIYDRIPEIEDVWLIREQTAACAGLYRISLKIRESIQDELKPEEQARLEARVTQQVIEVYNAHRNLGEDLDEVVIVGSQPVFLCGDIQIHSLRDPASIFADIFFRCAQQVISGFRVERYLDARDGGVTLDEMFSGPLTVHGRIAATGAERPGATIPMARLIALVQAVDGVTHVQRLALCDENGQPVQLDRLDGKVLRLRFPDKPQSTFLRLHFASGAVGHYDTPMAAAGATGAERDRPTNLQEEKALIVLDDARIALRKARFEFDTVRNTPQSLEQVVPAPEGVQRSLRDYYSIQHQFPAIYGINRFGVPASAPLKNKVSANQLKAYLFLAEQLMANYLENLHGIPQVFSLDDVQHTYFSQVLDDEALPHIESLYVGTLPQIGSMLSQMVARMDKSEDRRSRLIDVLLAMYGEEFSQKSLRRFNYYEDRHSARWLVDNKLAFLRHIAGLSRDRATAFDYTKGKRRDDDSPNLSGVHAKIAILLDLRAPPGGAPLSQELLKYRLRLSAAAGLSADHYAGAARHLTQLAAQANEADAGTEPASEGKPDASAAFHAPGGAILPASLLTQGVRLENYILEQHGETIHVHFQTHDAQLGVVRLGHYPDLAEADRHVQQLRSFICRLNIGSEGFYLVEHLLLRPRDAGADGDEAGDRFDGEFYSSRISVVFPGWSARFSDPDFRNLAQETVCRNLPAHLYPEFHWLDFISMRDFEQRHRLWLDRLRRHAETADPERLDGAAASVVKFLQRQRSALNSAYWV